MKRGIAALTLVPMLSMAGCAGGGDDDVVEKGTAKSQTASSGSASASTPAAAQGQLLEYGFGQDKYGSVDGVALIKNTSDHAGQTVTVNFNFLDGDGNIITSVSQVDSFNYPGQTIATQGTTYLDSPKTKIASVEPTLLVEDDNLFDESDMDYGTAEGKIVSSYGAFTGRFVVPNPTSDPLQSPAVRVACRDAGGQIIGGGFTFPDLVPPNGQTSVDVDLTVSTKPDSCLAYIGAPVL